MWKEILYTPEKREYYSYDNNVFYRGIYDDKNSKDYSIRNEKRFFKWLEENTEIIFIDMDSKEYMFFINF